MSRRVRKLPERVVNGLRPTVTETRCDKTATLYLAGLRLAATFIWSARYP
ncbi:hypothetical protein ACFYNW_37835 [Streptomyces virginiae]